MDIPLTENSKCQLRGDAMPIKILAKIVNVHTRIFKGAAASEGSSRESSAGRIRKRAGIVGRP